MNPPVLRVPSRDPYHARTPESQVPPSVDLATNCKGNTISSGIGLTDATDSGTFPLQAFGGFTGRIQPLGTQRLIDKEKSICPILCYAEVLLSGICAVHPKHHHPQHLNRGAK